MCGRLTKTKDERDFEIREFVKMERIFADLRPRYNIAPSQPLSIIRLADDGERELVDVRWGFLPRWVKDLKESPKPINAMCETVANKPYFRDSFKFRRCCILADGFYEWKATENGKQPYYFRMKDRSLFFLAGLWDSWSAGEKPIETCVIITTTANELNAQIHDRMPVILRREAIDLWLNLKTSQSDLLSLLTPYESNKMETILVSKLVNSPKNDNPDCIIPYAA